MTDRRALVLTAVGIGTLMAAGFFWLMVVDAYVQALMDTSISRFICRTGPEAGPVTGEIV